MVSQPPEELKSIRPFIRRGIQCSSVEPIITYYCYFYAVQQILQKGLHKASPQCGAFTAELMDDLEQRKDALKATELGQMLDDELVAQAYVEGFATKVFNNGNRAVEQRVATAKTADSLEAASVFLDLLNIFKSEGEGGENVAKQVKYCKYHAARILKALREGTDPNPAPPSPAQAGPSHPPAPTVEEVPDDPEETNQADHDMSIREEPRQDNYDMSIEEEPTNNPSLAPQDPSLPLFPSAPADPETAHNMPPPSASFFPPVPGLHDASATVLPSAPSPQDFSMDHEFTLPSVPSLHDSSSAPSFLHQPPPTIQPPAWGAPPSIPAQPNPYSAAPAQSKPRRHPTPEDIAKAQKFAKWAISALDYEDIDNAILQFRSGLEALGAL